MQLDMVFDLPRVGLNAWLLFDDGAESNMHLEVSNAEYGRVSYGTHASCVVPSHEPGRRNYRHRCRRRDLEILERIPEAREHTVED